MKKIKNYISSDLLANIQNYIFVSLIISVIFINKIFFYNIENIELFEWFNFILLGILGFIFLNNKEFLEKINLIFLIPFLIFFIIDFEYNFTHIIFLIFSAILSYYKCKLNYKNINLTNFIIDFSLFFIIFYFSTKLIHWVDLDKFIFFKISENSKLFLQFKYIDIIIYAYTLLVYLIFFVLLIISFTKDFQNRLLNKYWYILPTIIFFIISFSTSDLFCNIGGCAKYHWQPVIGPLKMMSQGGLLLWDTPSTYGFLSILSAYLIPFEDPWLKMYFLNSILRFLIGLLIFRAIWNKEGVIWYFTSLALVFALVYVVPSSERFINSATVPQGGAMRFFWTVLLMFMIIKLKDRNFKNQIFLTTPIWLVGTLWSAESAFFVNTIMSSFIFFTILNYKKNFIQKIKIITILPVSFLLSILLISIFYIIKIGNFPDFFSYIESALMHSKGYYSENMSIKMPFIVLLLMLSFIIYSKTEKSYLAIKASIWFVLWAVTAYSIGQSVGVAFLKILVIYIFGSFLIINLLKKSEILNFKLNLIPIFMIIVALSFGNPKFAKYIYQIVKNQDYLLKNVKHYEDENLNIILTKIEPKKIPIIYIEPTKYLNSQSLETYKHTSTGKDILLSDKIWLPIYPASNIIGLPKKSKIKYFKRWENRHSIKKAWYISPINKTFIKPLEDVLEEYLVNYSLIKEVKSGKLIAKLYEKK